ncbi:hypothetical protein FNH05_01680 [Amycolatopsis rhizosphaerae]|uniref:Thioesterase domain-containing protein n=1 Tax=Amycolatopsis rhizosphaerae TaxID=2053003 RepID=A0A558DLT8_9PSEU|nr:hypothetical protein [Amycolatopsis rhizosphaerae]TVT61969.1 hypothetical protein FNH05_01680 [Amycolatopsis rhizosphaerae]
MSAPEPNLFPDRQRDHDRLYGTGRTVHYEVTAADSARRMANRKVTLARGPEIATFTRLLELCKWPCVDAVRETIEPNECSLDASHRLEYRVPVPIGTRLVITARCTVSNHPYSEWEVSVHNGYEDVCHATLAFIAVDRAEFEQEQVKSKRRRRHRTASFQKWRGRRNDHNAD